MISDPHTMHGRGNPGKAQLCTAIIVRSRLLARTAHS
jgi:hypothetical protein